MYEYYLLNKIFKIILKIKFKIEIKFGTISYKKLKNKSKIKQYITFVNHFLNYIK